MAKHCKNCGVQIIENPIFKDYSLRPRWVKGNIIWKNMFKIDVYTLMWLVVVLTMAFSYKQDIAIANEVISNPRGFCEGNHFILDPKFFIVGEPDLGNVNISIGKS